MNKKKILLCFFQFPLTFNCPFVPLRQPLLFAFNKSMKKKTKNGFLLLLEIFFFFSISMCQIQKNVYYIFWGYKVVQKEKIIAQVFKMNIYFVVLVSSNFWKIIFEEFKSKFNFNVFLKSIFRVYLPIVCPLIKYNLQFKKLFFFHAFNESTYTFDCLKFLF